MMTKIKVRDLDYEYLIQDSRELPFPDNHFEGCVTDPPYELGFMNKKWDSTGIAYDINLWKELFRILKPGAYLLSFGGTRTYHRMACAVEDAGFEVRDMINWLYGSGFPKSLDISKAIDKMGEENKRYIELSKELCDYLRESRENLGLSQKDIAKYFLSKTGGLTGCVWNWENGMNVPTIEQWKKLKTILKLEDSDCNILIERAIIKRIEAEREIIEKDVGTVGDPTHWFSDEKRPTYNLTAPATPEAIQWQGYGTALKPAHEPIVLARKPLEKGLTVAQNVLKWGTGGLAIDKCRISHDESLKITERTAPRYSGRVMAGGKRGGKQSDIASADMKGRFPANLILECICDEVIPGEQGEIKVGIRKNTLKSGNGHFGGGARRQKPVRAIDYTDKPPIHTNPDCPCRMLDEQSGDSKSVPVGFKSIGWKHSGNTKEEMTPLQYQDSSNDSGGASRFFYCAKAPRLERYFYCKVCKEADNKRDAHKEHSMHCDDCGVDYEIKYNVGGIWDDSSCGLRQGCIDEHREHNTKSNLYAHPTQKPVSLIRYLIRLIIPPSGTVIDPFCGSGTIFVAAREEGIKAVGIDNDPMIEPIINKRLDIKQKANWSEYF